MKRILLILIPVIAFAFTSNLHAQCAGVQFDFSVVNINYPDGDVLGAPDIAAFVGVNPGGTNPVFANSFAPPTYNTAFFIENANTGAFPVETGQQHCIGAPLDGTFGVNIAVWENDCGDDDTYDCGFPCVNSDDNRAEIVGYTMTLPAVGADGCYATDFVEQTLTLVGEGDGCGGSNQITWTITLRVDITYVMPAPSFNTASTFQCGNMPTVSVNPAPGIVYTWQGGTGTGTVSGAQGQFYTPGASEVDVNTPGEYSVTVSAAHPCDASVTGTSNVGISVLPECPEIDQVTFSPTDICAGDDVTLNLTLKTPECGGAGFVEGTDYHVIWYMDGMEIFDGRGPDNTAGTADDVTGLLSQTYTVPFTGGCGAQETHTFRAEIVCVIDGPVIEQGVQDAYCASTLKSQYSGFGNDITNGYDNGCPGEQGSQGPGNMSGYFNPCNGLFDFTTFGGTTGQVLLNLEALPACAEVVSVDYSIQGTTSSGCNAAYGESWASETNFVFYTPDASPTTGGPAGSFTWSNAGYTNCPGVDCNQSGGDYEFTNSTIYAPGTSAQGTWQLLLWDDYQDGTVDGEINYIFFAIDYVIPPGCAGVTELDANGGALLTVNDVPEAADITMEPAVACPTFNASEIEVCGGAAAPAFTVTTALTGTGGNVTITTPAGCEFTKVIPLGVGGIPPCAPLPVELTEFTGHVNGAVNTLKWITATEINTAYFVVERSIDGINNWTQVGTAQAAGNTTQTQYYQLDDVNPVAAAYYRLRIVDFDESVEYSQAVYLARDNNGFTVVSIFPSPAQDLFNIQYTNEDMTQIDLSIVDALGRVLHNEIVNPASPGVETHSVDISQLADGVYFVMLNSNGQTQVKKLVKANP